MAILNEFTEKKSNITVYKNKIHCQIKNKSIYTKYLFIIVNLSDWTNLLRKVKFFFRYVYLKFC